MAKVNLKAIRLNALSVTVYCAAKQQEREVHLLWQHRRAQDLTADNSFRRRASSQFGESLSHAVTTESIHTQAHATEAPMIFHVGGSNEARVNPYAITTQMIEMTFTADQILENGDGTMFIRIVDMGKPLSHPPTIEQGDDERKNRQSWRAN
ncbi:hypothetical protein CPB85DRAFT_1457432 [Mucidula mucida]|nr:hypothetical protein CPB85DRAFT_1457432 [Mucidula mucida]